MRRKGNGNPFVGSDKGYQPNEQASTSAGNGFDHLFDGILVKVY